MPRPKQQQSSRFSMGEDVYLLSKSAISLNCDDRDYDRGTLPTNSAPYDATPRVTTRKSTVAAGTDRGKQPRQQGHNRWNSVSTTLSALFGMSNDGSSYDTTTTSNRSSKSKTKRVRIKGMYGFLIHNDFSMEMNAILLVCYLVVFLFSIIICIGPVMLTFVISTGDWCGLTFDGFTVEDTNRELFSGDTATPDSNSPYANPDYVVDPCRYLRVPYLCYLTMEECDMCRRLLCSVLFGGIIGYERRSSDRPAGIRTMGLVSLGACSFTISSIMAFKSSTMGWDASRVTAALPSGVGFLGGALIWKGSIFINDEEFHQVNGLTTAASVWLSAAVGVGCGGALYLVTGYVVILVVMILRYAPKSYLKDLAEMSEEMQEAEEEELVPPSNIQAKEETILLDEMPVSQFGSNGIDTDEDEFLDKITSMRASSRGLDQYDVPLNRTSTRMMKSKSTGSLRASLRAQFPNFAD
ncbi:MgtC family protein [Nitzschia inconspicua]|uniref:MgtC family protein n=1 Tax=Nitzschia inconspicua TaxID=303405 RepID=A0A9K3Q0Y9_9STRA|nr:MgtC family protein [Nitzschia inconspicua]